MPVPHTTWVGENQGSQCFSPIRGGVVLLGLLWLVARPVESVSGEYRVRIERREAGARLLRNDEPYRVKGAGGRSRLDLLASIGANSIRTWDAENLDELLDDAERNGLTVCVGMWLGHERHGFRYQDDSAVLGQLKKCVETVVRHKDHPAILMWGIGNEAEGDGHNPAVWYAIDHIAREVKRIDPHHPTMTVIAELGEDGAKLRNCERFCPNVDVVGVNSYGGIATLARRYRAAGGTKPYLVTEHGPPGPWEVGKTSWGAPIEPSSSVKARSYPVGFLGEEQNGPSLCLGSYAFFWGHKQETTATWFGMLLSDGSRLAAADAMSEAWTGVPPRNRCPQIESLVVEGVDRLKPGETARARLVAVDPERDTLRVTWVLRQDSGIIGVGGDRQEGELELPQAVSSQGMTATVTAPVGGGGYRLFAYVHDGNDGAAVANVAIHVDAPIRPFPPRRATLPYEVYGDGAANSVYVPSGYMGNTPSIVMEPDCRLKPHAGETCLKVQYRATDQWGGVLWQSPPNDWDGAKPGGMDLRGAVALEFWVRGEVGGEVVSFTFGGAPGSQPYRDSAQGEIKLPGLSREWQRVRLPVESRDLSRIKTGFGWSLAGQGQPVTFYLDDVRYVDK